MTPAFEAKAVLFKGRFTEADWVEITATIRRIEQRHPEDGLFEVTAICPDLSSKDLVDVMKRTFPAKPNNTPDVAEFTHADWNAPELFVLLRDCRAALRGTELGNRIREFLDKARR